MRIGSAEGIGEQYEWSVRLWNTSSLRQELRTIVRRKGADQPATIRHRRTWDSQSLLPDPSKKYHFWFLCVKLARAFNIFGATKRRLQPASLRSLKSPEKAPGRALFVNSELHYANCWPLMLICSILLTSMLLTNSTPASKLAKFTLSVSKPAPPSMAPLTLPF